MNPAPQNPATAFRDRDIIRDVNGMIYVTLGFIQPESRVLSFIKYIPDSQGKWESEGRRYRRVFWGGTASAADGMPLVPPDYIVNDPHFGTELLELPHGDITDHLCPESRLQQIMQNGPQDELEEDVVRIAEIIHDSLDIALNRIGVAGSILWNAHNPAYSDVNMVVHGYENGWKLEHGYERMDLDSGQIRFRTPSEWPEVKARILERIPALSSDDLDVLFSRRKALYSNERFIGVTPVLLPDEAPIRHSSESYATLNPVPIRVDLEILDDKYGIFTPAVYECISEPITEIDRACVTRLMIYEGVFGRLLCSEDSVEVVGTLQRVQPASDDPPFYQIMIGTKEGAGKELLRYKPDSEL
ncbi:MAG: hypothetical protein ACFE7R_02560 [Candidatus Hodarchaeota archaeon]